MTFPTNPQELEDFIARVTADRTAELIQTMEERVQSEMSAAVKEESKKGLQAYSRDRNKQQRLSVKRRSVPNR